jgi:hypothetical protein
LAKIIAEINEKIPSARGHQVVLNDDRKIYLYNGTDYREISEENLLSMEDKGCLSWCDAGTRATMVGLLEQSVFQKNRQAPEVLQDEDKILNPKQAESLRSGRLKMVLSSVVVLNLLALAAALALVVFRPVVQHIAIDSNKMYTKQLYRDLIYPNFLPTDDGNLFISENNSSLNGTSYRENMVLTAQSVLGKTKVPLYLGPLNFQTNSFAQNLPVLSSGTLVFTDNRDANNPSGNEIFSMDLNSYNTAPLLGSSDAAGKDTNAVDTGWGSGTTVDGYAVSGGSLFFSQSKALGQRGQLSRLVYRALDPRETAGSLKTDNVVDGTNNGSPLSISAIFASENWLLYNRGSNTVIKQYYVADSGVTFKNVSTMVSAAASSPLTPVGVYGSDKKGIALFLSAGNLCMLNLPLNSGSLPPSGTVDATGSVASTSSPAAAGSVFDAQDLQIVAKVDSNIRPVVLDNNPDGLEVVYVYDNNIFLKKIGETGPGQTITRLENTEKISYLAVYQNRIYWTQERKVQGQSLYDLYYSVPGSIPKP